MKTIAIASTLLLLAAPLAFAQLPGGPTTAPGGADGPARPASVGNTSSTAADTGSGRTQSSTMLMERIKADSAAGAVNSPAPSYDESVGLGRGAYGRTIGAGPAVGSSQALTAQAQLDEGTGPHRVAITDEYGFKYDARGDRLDARGNVISPHTR